MIVVTESFVDFYNESSLANEGFLSNIKENIKKSLLSLIMKIEKKLRSCRESSLRNMILSLLDRAKTLLGCVDSINTPEEASSVQEDIHQINDELDHITSDTNKKDVTKDRRWSKCPDYLKPIILANDIEKARVLIVSDLRKFSNSNDPTIDKIDYLSMEIFVLKYFLGDQLFETRGSVRAVTGNIEDGMKNLAGLTRLFSETYGSGELDSIRSQLHMLKQRIINMNKPVDDDIEDLY